jgi:hypothetical protein
MKSWSVWSLYIECGIQEAGFSRKKQEKRKLIDIGFVGFIEY